MSKPILVAFATKYGSTEEVAAEVAAVLVERGADVELRLASDLRRLDGYGAVILGAPLYMGRWHRDARRFLSRHEATLASVPTAVFALGPIHEETTEFEDAEQRVKGVLAKTPAAQPVDVAIFGGRVDPAELSFPFNRMPAADIRDWTAIKEWARRIADMLVPAAVAA
jgi:menaquinone-dependent protoporphyrinogen oxidase